MSPAGDRSVAGRFLGRDNRNSPLTGTVYTGVPQRHRVACPERQVDYQNAESQAIQLQQQANQVTQRLRDVADKLQARIPDPNLSRELMLDLREAAIAIQQQNQSALAMIQQMAQYIHSLESNLATAPQMGFQPRGWSSQPYPSSSGGFMGNVVSGLGMGAGFGIAESLVEDIFGRW